jgi:hypothetical protein
MDNNEVGEDDSWYANPRRISPSREDIGRLA